MSGMGKLPKIGSRSWVINSAVNAAKYRSYRKNIKNYTKFLYRISDSKKKPDTFCPTIDHY
jgi:hypothetical protein